MLLNEMTKHLSYTQKIKGTKSNHFIISVILDIAFNDNMSEYVMFYISKWWSNKLGLLPWQRRIIRTKIIYFQYQCNVCTTYKDIMEIYDMQCPTDFGL